MTVRAFWLVAMAYICLAIGATLSIYLFNKQADRLEQNTKRLNGAVGAACEIGIVPDSMEKFKVHQLATGQLVLRHHDCEVIVRKLEEGP